MTTLTWTIEWMQTSTQTINGHSEVVLTAGWRCAGVNASVETTLVTAQTQISNSCSFAEPSEGGSFTPYAGLTQDQVLGWCWGNGVDKNAIETQVLQQIALIENPPVIQPLLPWAGA